MLALFPKMVGITCRSSKPFEQLSSLQIPPITSAPQLKLWPRSLGFACMQPSTTKGSHHGRYDLIVTDVKCPTPSYGELFRVSCKSKPMNSKNKLDHEAMTRIIQDFDTDERLVQFSEREIQKSLPLELSFMLSGRLERAAENQLSDGEATVARYAIWADTLRGIILDAIDSIGAAPKHSSTKRNLTKAANSLAAFSTIQSRLDPFRQ